MEMVSQSESGEKFDGVIRIEEGKIRSHVDQVVRETVEQTLNGLLEAEADELCGAKRYARSPERLDTRAGHYERTLHTKAGEVNLQVPRLRNSSARQGAHNGIEVVLELVWSSLVFVCLCSP